MLYNSANKPFAIYVYCLSHEDGQGFRIDWALIETMTLMRLLAFFGQGSPKAAG